MSPKEVASVAKVPARYTKVPHLSFALVVKTAMAAYGTRGTEYDVFSEGVTKGKSSNGAVKRVLEQLMASV
jgi:hypothetical protein